MRITEILELVRKHAVGEAESALRDIGFVSDEPRHWHGGLDCEEFGTVNVSFALPVEFPDVLPEIHVDRNSLIRRVPHIEKSGKVCLADSTGVLIDTNNPQGIVRESLQRARSILIDGLSGRNEEDFINEFLAYWNDGARFTLSSICSPSEVARAVSKVRLIRKSDQTEDRVLLADSLEEANGWASRINCETQRREDAFYIPLLQPFAPPDFDELISIAQILDIIRNSTDPDTWRCFNSWISKARLPLTVVLSLPLAHDRGQAMIAIELPAATGVAKKQAERGFRPGRVPSSRELTCNKHGAIAKLRIDRLDSSYLLTRGGAALSLFTRTVAVVGCGSVGSRVVEQFAAMGVGHLRLVDPETLASENVHRHTLGVGFIGRAKVAGLKDWLGMNFPHIEVEARPEGIQQLLLREPEFITESSLMVIALGDETLELRLNNLLPNRLPRVHVWIEPLGLGGHVLSAGVSASGGCFKCLFETNAEHGLVNLSSFAAPGQRFQRSIAGCSGSFIPFANADADLAAIEASKLASAILTGSEKDNVLISWRRTANHFMEAGFCLSSRGKMFLDGEHRTETGFRRTACPDCSDHLE